MFVKKKEIWQINQQQKVLHSIGIAVISYLWHVDYSACVHHHVAGVLHHNYNRGLNGGSVS